MLRCTNGHISHARAVGKVCHQNREFSRKRKRSMNPAYFSSHSRITVKGTRTIAFRDTHGCSMALKSLIAAIHPQQQDIIFALGGYVDRGFDSSGVVEQLIALKSRCNLICVLGNHDQMMRQCKDSKQKFNWWMECGGFACLDSYGDSGRPDLIPKSHFKFLEDCVSFFRDRHSSLCSCELQTRPTIGNNR
ncbi:MAG TPA: hypothetical protein DDZ51_02195 [Planctomycetaceae bacterium]|nr:hypothetical protein [Planctomycetaceae bacterium]